MHLHIGIMHAIIVFLHVIVIGGIWRVITLRFKDTAPGQAMAILY